MGLSTNGILAYGYNLGGDESGWEIAEAGEYSGWEPAWFDADDEEGDDLASAAETVLLTTSGFIETDYRVEGYFERKREAEARVGVELKSYCSGDYPMYILAAHTITVARGSIKEIDFPLLEAARIEQDWDGKLTAALTVLGATPKQDAPKWLLVSYMG